MTRLHPLPHASWRRRVDSRTRLKRFRATDVQGHAKLEAFRPRHVTLGSSPRRKPIQFDPQSLPQHQTVRLHAPQKATQNVLPAYRAHISRRSVLVRRHPIDASKQPQTLAFGRAPQRSSARVAPPWEAHGEILSTTRSSPTRWRQSLPQPILRGPTLSSPARRFGSATMKSIVRS